MGYRNCWQQSDGSPWNRWDICTCTKYIYWSNVKGYVLARLYITYMHVICLISLALLVCIHPSQIHCIVQLSVFEIDIHLNFIFCLYVCHFIHAVYISESQWEWDFFVNFNCGEIYIHVDLLQVLFLLIIHYLCILKKAAMKVEILTHYYR